MIIVIIIITMIMVIINEFLHWHKTITSEATVTTCQIRNGKRVCVLSTHGQVSFAFSGAQVGIY